MQEEDEELDELEDMRCELWASFLLFCEIFYPAVFDRPFIISQPTGRESHHKIIARELEDVAELNNMSLLINIQPGSGKSVMLCLWVAWCMSRYPDSNFIYIAYGFDLASSNTSFIKRIMQTKEYKEIFDVHIRADTSARDHFATTAGGVVRAFGSSGPVTGASAGFMIDSDEVRFTGALIIDDATKPDEAHSDTIRQSILRNYKETILQRPRGPHVPMICIAQRLHEDDLCAHMLSGEDEREWRAVVLKSLDEAGNALCPDVTTREQLIEKLEKSPYTAYAQFQQNPQPAGGSIFKEKDFVILDDDPESLATFITCDSAETDKDYNDATAISFWSVYKLPSGPLALHLVDAVEIFVEPKDLEQAFRDFYTECLRYKTPPLIAAIEKKSTGATLLSVLKETRGLEIRDIKRTKTSKIQRFFQAQPYTAAKLISLPARRKHTKMFVEHMGKITGNDSHRRDDLCDTCIDAIQIALIDKTIFNDTLDSSRDAAISNVARASQNRINALKGSMPQW